MPLLDHFRAPIYPRHDWESFHARWAVALSDMLNGLLPPRYLAEVQIHIGRQVEADVAEFELTPSIYCARVFDMRESKRLVGVIELISPGNKDRPEARRTFAAKCIAYLQRGIGLILVDIVTIRGGNLHHGVLELLGQPEGSALPADTALYAAAYHPAHRSDKNQLDLWPMALALGQPLPLLPLALRGAFFVPVDLEATYSEARQRCRL